MTSNSFFSWTPYGIQSDCRSRAHHIMLHNFCGYITFREIDHGTIFSSPEQRSQRAIVLLSASAVALESASTNVKVFVKVFKTSLFPNFITDLIHLLYDIGPKFCAVPSPPP